MVDPVNAQNGVKNSKFGFNSNSVVILAAFWVNFCLLGVLRSNAVIYRAFVDVYEVNRQHAAWPSGIFGFFMCVTGAMSGFLSHYVSIRTLAVIGAALASASVSICSVASHMPQIVFLYGALQGVGMGLIVPLTHVILNQNFTKYKACALGIAYSGSSAGSFVFPPLTNLLLGEFGLQGTFLLLGGIMSNSLMGTLLFRTPKSLETIRMENATVVRSIERGKTAEVGACAQEKYFEKPPPYNEEENFNKKNSSLFVSERTLTVVKSSNVDVQPPVKSSVKLAMEVLSNPYFFIVSLAYAVYFSTSAIFLMVALDFAKDRGVTTEEGVFLISAFSIGDFAGRLTFGWIADTKYVRRNVVVRCYLIAMGVLTALLPVFPTRALPAASVLLGIVNGSVIINHSVLLNEYLGIQKLPLAMGFSTCFVGITAFLRPLVIGAFRDNNQSYDYVFLFMGLLQVSITLLWFLESFVQFIRQKPVVKNFL